MRRGERVRAFRYRYVLRGKKRNEKKDVKVPKDYSDSLGPLPGIRGGSRAGEKIRGMRQPERDEKLPILS